MLETYWNKNGYCLEFDLTGSDLGFTTRFWNLCYNELLHDNRRKWKSMDLSMDLWHSNNLKVILPNFTKDHCFWTLWTLNYVDCIPFSCIDYFQILSLNFWKTWWNLHLCGRSSIKSVLRCFTRFCVRLCSEVTSPIYQTLSKNLELLCNCMFATNTKTIIYIT